MTVVAILALIALVLYVVSLFPQADGYRLGSVAGILLAIAVLVIGRGGH